ncbi:ATP-binding protein [Patescibacteria group bacterium]
MMNIFAISGILIFITSAVMAGFMFATFKISRNRLHLIWGLFCVSVSIWGGGAYKIATTTNIQRADFWWRITHIGIIFIPILFTHFVYTFLNFKRKKIIITLYILGVFFLITNFIGNLFIANMRFVFNQFYYDSPPGIFYIPFTIMFFSLVIYSHIELWIAYQKASGLKKDQIKYFIVGMAVSFFGGSLSFLPVYKIDFYPVLNLAVCFYPIIIAYAITRYRLMDIRIVIRKSFIYFLAAVFSYCFFYFTAWMLISMFGSIYATGAFLFGIIIALVFSVLFFSVEKFIRFIANKYFFSALYSQHETLRQVSKKLTAIVDVKDLINNVNDVIRQTLAVDKITFILKNKKRDSYKTYKQTGFKNGDIEILIKNKKIINYLSKNVAPLAIEEISNKNILGLKEKMEIADVALLLPLPTKHGLQGLIVLGAKVNNDSFSKEDIELLRMLANQTALAVENASLYDGMENIIEKQTRAIREKNVKLKKLLGMKTEFLHIASHQLRTPVSAIKGLVSMFQEGDFDKEDKKTKKRAFDGIFQKTNDMTHILDDILIASELDSKKKFQLNKRFLKKICLEEITNKAIASLKYLAKDKNIKVSYAKKSGGTQMILGDEKNIRQIMVNLLGNAIIYTAPKGKVEISIKDDKTKKQVIWYIKDNGIGIPKSSQPYIFDKFKRSKNANTMNCNGSGLGLFIVKALVESHKGAEVGFESKEGEGSLFWVKFKGN